MSRCLNLSGDNLEKFNSLVDAVGQVEAVREFLEAADNNREIGTPEQVKEKIAFRNKGLTEAQSQSLVNSRNKELIEKFQDVMYHDSETTDGIAILGLGLNKKTLSLNDQNQSQAQEIVDKLSSQTGIKYNVVSEDEAMKITANAANPYYPGKQPAFFYNGEIYFVKEILSTEIALHEFAHPIIRSIKLNAPEVFDKLYRDAIQALPEYYQEALNEYADLKKLAEEEVDPELKSIYQKRFEDAVAEELLVKGLTQQAMLANDNIKPNKVKSDFFTNLLFHIKQTLRKLFGRKINISKLDGNTTLGSLAKMLVEGGNFEISTEEVNDSTVVSYFNDQMKYVEDMKLVIEKSGNKEFMNLIRYLHNGVSNQIKYLQTSGNYSDLVDLLVDEFNRGDLQEIRSNISKYASLINKVADEKLQDLQYTENQTTAFVTSMMRLDLAIEKMRKHLRELEEDPTDKDNVHKAEYYANVLKYWESYLDQFQKVLDSNNAQSDSPINSLVNKIRGNIRAASSSVNKINTNGVTEVLWNTWKTISAEGDRVFNEKIESLRARGASESMIEKEYVSYYGLTRAELSEFNSLKERLENGEDFGLYEGERYENLKLRTIDAIRVTKEKIEAKLRGEGKDANWANSFLEGYLYNTDPVIGGFAMYYRDNMTDMENRIQARLNEASKELSKLAKDANVNFNDVGGLGKDIGYVDTIGYFNVETNTFEGKKVWTLLNPYKDYRYVIDKFNHEIRELEKTYNFNQTPENKMKLIDKMNEKEKHLREWFHDEFVEDYYKDTNLVKSDDDTIGKLAQAARDEVLDEIKMYGEPAMGEYEKLIRTKTPLDIAWRKYRLLYSLYNVDGTKKKGQALEIAKRLQENREKTRKYYEYKERPGAFQNALQRAESEIKTILAKQGLQPNDPEYIAAYEEKRNNWIKANTRIVLKESFYKERAKIIERIKAITSKLPSSQANEIDFSEYWKDILDVVAGYRDDDGHPVGPDVPEGRRSKVRDAQQAMQKAKEKYAGFTGLEKEEFNRLIELSAKRKILKSLSTEEYNEWVGLIQKQKSQGLSKSEIEDLNQAFADLNELQRKEPTEYYLDQLNNWLEKMNLTEIYKKYGITELNAETVEILYNNEDFRNELFSLDKDFKSWFESNHIEKTSKDGTVYERLYIWNVIRPNDSKYYETTNVKDENGNIVPIMGLPKMQYYNRQVKKEFRTGYDKATGLVKPIVGVHIDNRGVGEGGWLPKEKPNSPYINERYFALKNAPVGSKDEKLFKLLEGIKKFHLKSQENLPRKDRLYFDFPRFEMSNLELAQSGIAKKRVEAKLNFIQQVFKKFKDWIQGRIKDDPSYSYDRRLNLVRIDAYGDQIDNIPIQGLYNLDYTETSTNILDSVVRYAIGAEHKKQLLKMNPTAKALKDILEKNSPKDIEKASVFDYLNLGIFTYQNKKGKYVRKSAINNFYDRDFLGQKTTGFLADSKWLINIQNFLFGRAAFTFFALNIPSALKNQMSAKFQAMLEAAGGENITYTSLAKGQVWSSKYVFSGSKNIYDTDPKNLDHQIGDIFDFSRGRFLEKAGDPITRTVFKDVASMTWLYSPRKFLELEASAQTFAGMMYKKKVMMGDTEIDYMDAWELDSQKQIRLKDKIDVRYGNASIAYTIDPNDTVEKLAAKYYIPVEEMREIYKDWKVERRLAKVKELNNERNEKLSIARDQSEMDKINRKYDRLVEQQLNVEIENTGFKIFRSKVHSVMEKLNGAYSSFAQPEAQRYILFRFISNLRRFFITMFMQRYGKRRWNPGYSKVDEGYYITFVKGVYNAIRNLDPTMLSDLFKSNSKTVDPDTKRATYKVLAEIGKLYLLALVSSLFGFDLDDEDKYEKLREMSGPLPLGFIGEKENQFDLSGWLGLHTLNLAYQVKSENEQFLPLPYLGFDNLTEMANIKAIAFGPTLDSYVTIGGDMLDFLRDDPRQFYKRRVGAYEWQQQGSRKIWNHIAKIFGINANTIDPAQALTNLVKAQSLAKI